jgi:cold shock protein
MTTEYSTVKWFDAKKGYGFINHPEGGDDIFVHYSQIDSTDDFKTLRTGQSVRFEMNDGPKGLHAVEVKALEEESSDTPAAEEDVPPLEQSVMEEPVANEPVADEPVAEDPVTEDPSPEPGVTARGVETNSSLVDPPFSGDADSDPPPDQGTTEIDSPPGH